MTFARLLLPALLLSGCHEAEMGWPRPDFGANIEYGPQLACATGDSIRVCWRAFGHVRGAVEVHREGETGWRSYSGEPGARRDHDIEVDGLDPRASYRYRLLHDGIVVDGPHRIGSRDPERTRFVVLGDSGSGGPQQAQIARRIAEQDPEFVLHTGDLAYDFGTRRETLRRFFVPYAESLATRPWYVAWGNHDVMTDGGRPAREMIRQPGTHYYSFDWGGVRFYSLNTNLDFEPGSRQYEWLVADIAENPGRRRVAFFHHPPYSASSYARTFPGTSLALREHLCPLFDRHGFELVFNGHVHGYERAQPAGAKPVYFVTGGGGKRLNDAGRDTWTRASAQVWHLCVVTIERSGGFSVSVLDADGAVIDRYPEPRDS